MFRVEFTGTKEVSRKVAALGRQLSGSLRRKGFRRVARVLKKQHLERLNTTKRDADGKPWAPWSDSYAATRGPEHSLLQDRFAMTRGLKVVEAGPDLMFGTDKPYAVHHQEGTSNMPARPPFGVGDADVPGLQAALDEWFMEEAGRRGLS